MTSSSFLTYLAFTFVLVVTPGASTAVVVRNTLAGGRSLGVATAAGAAVGNTSYAIASGLGLAALFARWPAALNVLGIFGASYFVWLGGESLLRAVRTAQQSQYFDESRSPTSRLGGLAAFRRGAAVNLLNPPIATFYLTVVPSFIPLGAPWWVFGLLAATHVTMAFLCHCAWALAFESLGHLFGRGSFRRGIDVATGLTMLLLAWRVLISVRGPS
jgi:threonine/homoserine/homoserine lactone efflux protein